MGPLARRTVRGHVRSAQPEGDGGARLRDRDRRLPGDRRDRGSAHRRRRGASGPSCAPADVRLSIVVVCFAPKPRGYRAGKETIGMFALIVLLLIVAVFGGFGFAAHFLWFVLLVALALWLLGFFVGGVEAGGARRRGGGRGGGRDTP